MDVNLSGRKFKCGLQRGIKSSPMNSRRWDARGTSYPQATKATNYAFMYIPQDDEAAWTATRGCSQASRLHAALKPYPARPRQQIKTSPASPSLWTLDLLASGLGHPSSFLDQDQEPRTNLPASPASWTWTHTLLASLIPARSLPLC